VLANRLYGATTALFAVLVTNIVPICGAGAIIMTQDPVQIAFWSLSLVGAWWAVNSQNDQAALAWLTTGLLVGLTGMSKLNGLFMLPSIALFCAVSPDHRRWLTRWEPYAATVVACALMLPFLWWNHAHGNMFWVHLHAMSGRGTGHGFTVRWVGDYLGSQALFLSPLLFITLLVCLFKPIRSRETVAQDLFVWSCTSVTLIATVGLALRNKVEGNWGVTAFVGGSILIARAIVCSWSRSSARRWNITGLVLAAVLSLCILYPSVLYSLGIKMSPNKDRTMELYGWRQLANRVATEQSAVGGPNKSFVFGINYRMPSEMAFYLPGQHLFAFSPRPHQ
jgi:4-amino-4-deoxy-L-arabinose transferase-like glycosyltransferase